MFDKLIEYYSQNPALLYYTIGAIALGIILGVAVVILSKSLRIRREQKQMTMQAIETLQAEIKPSNEQAENEPSNEQAETEPVDPTPAQETTPSEQNEQTDLSKDTQASQTETQSESENTSDEKKSDKPSRKKKQQVKDELSATADNNAIPQTQVHPEEQKRKPTSTRYAGKWIIFEENGRFYANLVASNGEILLRTEAYSALSGIKSGIETINKNVKADNFALSIDKNGKYFFKLYSSKTRLLCVSEVYANKTLCERAVESVKRFSQTAVVVREKDAQQNQQQ